MRGALGGVLLGFALLSPPTAATAQPDPYERGESTARAGLDSILVAAILNPTWKGYRLGSYGSRLFAGLKVAGRPVSGAGRMGISAFLSGTAVKDPMPGAVSSGHVGAGLALSGYFNGGDGAIRLSAESYRLSKKDERAVAREFGLSFRGLEWEWGLEELSPRLAGGVYKGAGKFDGTRADLNFTLAGGMQNVAPWGFRDIGAWIELYGSWSDYFDPDETPELSAYSWHVGSGLELDRSALALSFRLRWVDAFDADGAAWSELAIRIWPDARDSG